MMFQGLFGGPFGRMNGIACALFEPMAHNINYRELCHQQRCESMLRDAPPNHFVASATWRTRDGSYSEVFIIVPCNADSQAELQNSGWPGHRGRRIDYFKEDIRRILTRMAKYLGFA